MADDDADDRKVSLVFACADCGEVVQMTNAGEIFNLVNTQIVAEAQRLLCWDCVEK